MSRIDSILYHAINLIKPDGNLSAHECLVKEILRGSTVSDRMELIPVVKRLLRNKQLADFAVQLLITIYPDVILGARMLVGGMIDGDYGDMGLDDACTIIGIVEDRFFIDALTQVLETRELPDWLRETVEETLDEIMVVKIGAPE
jgi:hypothetical protein